MKRLTAEQVKDLRKAVHGMAEKCLTLAEHLDRTDIAFHTIGPVLTFNQSLADLRRTVLEIMRRPEAQ